MQLFEVKNDIAKIIYNPAENHLLPSDFLLIQDVNQKLIAQIVNISTTRSTYDNLADVRLVLSIDNEDNLSYYNGYIPSKSCSIVYLCTDEIIELIKGQGKTILLGNLSNHTECIVTPSIDLVKDKVYIQSDRDDNTKIVIQNIVAEIISSKEKVIVLDFDGCYNSITNVQRLKITEDIKLPLDIEAFNTILEYEIADCPIEDKAVVQSIILELKEYLKTLKNQFLPFNLFKNVIEQEFASNPISGLMVLRNKLWMYAQSNLFAENTSQINVINNTLENHNLVIIDASEIDEIWYKFVIQTIKNSLNKSCYLVLSLNDALMDKKAILNLYNNQKVIPVVYTNYNSKYRQILKSICKNQILFKPTKIVENDEPYSILLNKINSAEFIIYGETTLYLPLIIELQSYNIPVKNEINETEIEDIKNQTINLIEEDNSLQEKINVDKAVTVDMPAPDDFFRPMSMQEDLGMPLKENNMPDEDIIEDDFNDADLDFLDEQVVEPLMGDNNAETATVLETENQYDIFTPLENQVDNSIKDEDTFVENIEEKNLIEEKEVDIDKILELDEENDIIDESETSILDEDFIDNSVQELEEINLTEEVKIEEQEKTEAEDELAELENEVKEDIDSELEEEIIPIDDVINDITSKLENKDDEAAKEELKNENFEIELESDEEELIPPPIKDDINTKESPELTVYPASVEEEISEKNIPFQIGDRVYHPKHGYGVIEGFANYSNKILFCQIEFEKVGRRILDPRIAGIEKVS